MKFAGAVAFFAFVFFQVAVAAPAVGLEADSAVSPPGAYLVWLSPHNVTLNARNVSLDVGVVAVEARKLNPYELSDEFDARDAAVEKRGEPLYSILTEEGE